MTRAMGCDALGGSLTKEQAAAEATKWMRQLVREGAKTAEIRASLNGEVVKVMRCDAGIWYVAISNT